MLTAAERAINLFTVADTEHRDVPPLHVGQNAQAFHRAHGRCDLTRTPKVLSVLGLQKVPCYIIGRSAKAVNIRAEDCTSHIIALELPGKKVMVFDDAVLVYL